MAKRLDDTKAVQAMVPYESQSEHYSRTVRKIDNGYVTSHYGRGPNDPDGPTNKEVFTMGHPDGDINGNNELHRNESAMKKAVSYMKKEC